MTRRNGPRFSDSKDFDETHDAIMSSIINNPMAMVPQIFGNWPFDIVDDKEYEWVIDERIERVPAEQEIAGAFPDITLEVSVGVRHRFITYWKEGWEFLYSRNSRRIHGGKYVLGCSNCHKEIDLFEMTAEQMGDISKSAGEDEPGEKTNNILWSMAWDKAREKGYRRVETPDSKYYDEVGNENPLCFRLNYFAFIEIKSHIKSLGETLRQLRIYDSIGKRISDDDIVKEGYGFKHEFMHRRSDARGYTVTDREDGFNRRIYKGTFIVSPDTKFRYEFENQGFVFIPFQTERKKESSLDDFRIQDRPFFESGDRNRGD